MIRSLFIPEEGHTWGCFDYSQQEPRLVVHYNTLHGLYGVMMLLMHIKMDQLTFIKL